MTGKTDPVSGSVHSKVSGMNFDAVKSPAVVSKFAQKRWLNDQILLLLYILLTY